jgi:hypothetical protein
VRERVKEKGYSKERKYSHIYYQKTYRGERFQVEWASENTFSL